MPPLAKSIPAYGEGAAAPTWSDNPRGSSGGKAPAGTWQPASGAASKRKAWRSGITGKDLLTFTSQLSIMSRAGVDLATSLQSLARQCRHPKLQVILKDIDRDVTSGQRISDALGRHAHVFGESYVASVAAGEASGRLPEVLDQLARLQRSDLRLRSSIRTLMAYPIMLISVSSMVLLALVLFVLPQFAGIFEQFEMELPFLTQMMLSISAELKQRFWLWGIVAGLGGVGLVLLRTSRRGRYVFDSVLVNARFVRDVTRALFFGRTCRMMSIMVANGVPLLDCIRLARASMSNLLYRDLFSRLEQEVLNGNGVGKTLLRSNLIPPSAAEMLVTAERTGAFATVTELLGEHFEEEAQTKLKELVTVIEPAITVGLGLIVAVVVLSVMLPMFDLASIAQKS